MSTTLFFQGLPFGLGVIVLRRGAFLRHEAQHWARGVAGAVLSGLSTYRALGHDAGAGRDIAALRETSVIFAALIGAWLLKEGHLRQRLSGAAVALAGLVALRL
jgi:uncharacterized membrane protein